MFPSADTARRHSLWLARQLDGNRLDHQWLEQHLPRPLQTADFAGFADWAAMEESDDETAIGKTLRILRRHVMAHTIIRDLNGNAPLEEVMQTITRFADFAVNTAARFAHGHYARLYGNPRNGQGETIGMSVIAMGKAGGGELNVSSDIDLIFIYPENGETDGRRSRNNQEFFLKTGKKLIALLDETTDEGFVFRVDMRLRPDGESGPLALSEAALEQYLVSQGREWERYAWCKARVLTPHANNIAALIRPFVFRKYLDYNAYEAMRGLHRQICREVSRKGMENNIKLGAGGIREVEFIAQIFQMIRGGQNPGLQCKGTVETLAALAEYHILPAETAADLTTAYRFLRNTEHRLQYRDDQQTQTLPEDGQAQQSLAESMGFDCYANFLHTLDGHRRTVSALFRDILKTPENENEEHPLDALWAGGAEIRETARQLADMGFADPETAARLLHTLRSGSRYRRLSAGTQLRFDALIPKLIDAAAASPHADAALVRLLGFLETVSRRPSYLAFLQQYPQQLQRMAELMSQSAWLAGYLQNHPALLDELLSAQLLAPLDWDSLSGSLNDSLAHSSDTESKMDLLRRFQHAQTFRLAVQDLAGLHSVESISDELSRLADTILTHTLAQVWQHLPDTHTDTPRFAVIGYGKLGGKELGYTSDLDLVYLYDDPHPDAADLYAKLARRLNTWLNSSTGAGTLYETDLRLRPDGDAGFLVHSLSSWQRYQQETAWTWEHQALSRARFVCGDPHIGEAFEALRRQILSRPRDPAALKNDIRTMRVKIADGHPQTSENIKFTDGGIIDVEFTVQYLVLQYSGRFPELLENYGNIALLDMAAKRGLIARDNADTVGSAYRCYRQMQHDRKLRDHAATPPLLSEYRQAVSTLARNIWQAEKHLPAGTEN